MNIIRTCQVTLIIAFALLGCFPQVSTAIGAVFATLMFVSSFAIQAWIDLKKSSDEKALEARFRAIDIKLQELTLGRAFNK